MSINAQEAWMESTAETRWILLQAGALNGIATMAPGYGTADAPRAVLSMIRAKALAAFESWKRRRAIVHTVSELSRLDDHVLKDIGVDHADIHVVARSAVEASGFKTPALTRRGSIDR